MLQLSDKYILRQLCFCLLTINHAQNTDQEQSHLLPDQTCNTTIQHGAMPEDYHYGTLPKETEEQAGLNRILDEITS